VEELLQRPVLTFQELDIVEQEQVDAAIARLELVHALLADPLDEVVEEGLGAQVDDLEAGMEVMGMLGDCLEQMGLAQTRSPEHEQRVVVAARLFGDGHRRGMGEAIALSNDKVFERVLRNEPSRLGMGRNGCGRSGLGFGLVVDDRALESLAVGAANSTVTCCQRRGAKPPR
jgi:hypothetical protein